MGQSEKEWFTDFIVDEVSIDARGYATGSERSLFAALLFDGIQTYLNHSLSEAAAGRVKYEEALLWVHDEDYDYVFSFNNVCEGLGIDPAYLRLGLLNIARSSLM